MCGNLPIQFLITLFKQQRSLVLIHSIGVPKKREGDRYD